MKTYVGREVEVQKKWYLVDGQGQVLGRLASQIAMLLRGKTKPIYTPHADVGDFVVVVNAEQVRLTGKKLDNKIYYRHTGYIGGIKSITARKLLDKKPDEVLKIYAGDQHPHQSQQPETLTLEK
ncbi:MAG: 50S ribosomal protein L13 [Desulfobacca sp. 4484_104]|nr:MAG: 50S ribosomal protein L13 [Desulfobacca sp. 4484_104]